MRTLFLDCGMGAAGDMLTAALLENTGNVEDAVKKLNALKVPGVEYTVESAKKCGITGTHVHVLVNGEEEGEETHHHHHEHEHEHTHDGHTHSHSANSLHDIEHIVKDHINAKETVKENILGVYKLLAETESKVHGEPVSQIHFHEVGNMDAIADIAAVCFLIDELKVERIVSSPIHVGRGTVKCAHGILPVPAPATAVLLENIPVYSRPEVTGELCTPTGAALLKYFVNEFGEMPQMAYENVGYGMGKKDFPIANCVRTFVGETSIDKKETVTELLFSVDDMTGEEIAFATNLLLESGAKDVFTTAIGMKKGRPGVLVTVLTKEEKKEELLKLIFKHTTTIGVRERVNVRYELDRTLTEEETKFGTVRKKESSGFGVTKSKYEYEDLARIAKNNNLSIRDVLNNL
ncbi:MAG: nickel pincer cofactor biosynthesis protein LarC [Lachnospiraceae bacterium]|nr:nickel pincer cofactor biosynthesis protein LarC [Lachnospiraceae bacterium]